MKSLEELLLIGLDSKNIDASKNGINKGTLRHDIFQYVQFCAAIREIAYIHNRWRRHGVAGGLLLYGQSGSGKSTVLDYYLNQFPRLQELVTQITVLKVLTPESPTVKSLAEAILYALGDPAADRGTAATKTRRIVHLLSRCKVELLLLDEFHHFYEGHRIHEGRRVSDWLKNLLSQSNIPIVLCGLPRSIAALNANSQLRRRFSAPHHLKEFGFTTPKDQVEFRGLLLSLEGIFPVKAGVSLSEPGIARRMYFATCGLIDYVIKLIDGVISRTPAGSLPELSLLNLAESFRKEIWAAVPDELNPFLVDETKLRLLKAPREPFDGWDDPSAYTLSTEAAALKGARMIEKKIPKEKDKKQ